MDPLYEFDAPRFFDFKRDDDGASMASQWFDGREEEGEEADSLRSPLSELPRDHHNKQSKPLSKGSGKKSNLVTSWAATAEKKTGSTRSTGQENAGAVRRTEPPITRSVTKAKQQALAGGPSAKPPNKASTKLHLVAPVMKQQAATATKRSKSRYNVKSMLQAKKILPVRSTKPLTLPDEGVDRLMSRGSKRSIAKPTAPAPASPFKPLAVKVQEFMKRTPGRFKHASRSQPPTSKGRRTLTKPKAPVLLTNTRARTNNMVSSEQREVDELSKLPKFKASKVKPEILSGSGSFSNRLGLLPPKKLTRPEPFNFVTDDRADRRRIHPLLLDVSLISIDYCWFSSNHLNIQVEPVSAFKAAPLDRNILEGPVGAGFPSRSTFNVTIPKSPLLLSKLRSQDRRRSHQVMNLEEPEKKEFHARPVPQFLLVPCHEFKPAPSAMKPTQPQPFSLLTDQRGRAYEQSLRAKISEEEKKAKKARIPRAQLLPQSLEVPIVPPKPEPRGLTLPHPFNLRSEVRSSLGIVGLAYLNSCTLSQARHHEFLEDFSHDLKLEAEMKRSRVEFKALPLPRLDRIFHPHECDLPLTMPKDPKLATRSRAADRAEFDRAMEEKMRFEEMQRQAEEEVKKAAEEEAVRRLRKASTFKAKPIPDFSHVPMAMPCSKPLTVPESPKLGRGSKRGREGR